MLLNQHRSGTATRLVLVLTAIFDIVLTLMLCVALVGLLPWLGLIRYDGTLINLQGWVIVFFLIAFPVIAIISYRKALNCRAENQFLQMLVRALFPLFWLLIGGLCAQLAAVIRPAGWYPIF